MEKKIKVFLNSGLHSEGRGVGFYAKFLGEALAKLPEVELTENKPDVIHYPFFDLFYPTLPFRKTAPTVVTVHDLTPLVMTSRYPKGVKGSVALLRQYLSLKGAKAVITDSNNSRDDIVRLFHYPKEKVHVTPLAIDPAYSNKVTESDLKRIKSQYALPDKFVLCVSAGPNPNKNLPALAKATESLNIPLVLVGKGLMQEIKEPIHPELKDLVELKKYHHVIFPGFVSTEDLNGMYKLATVYCQPSLYEGFGLPVLEAMTAGCLIVCSNTSSLPEIYHQGALTFDPADSQEMERGLNEAITLPIKEKTAQIEAGLKRSRDFTWEKTALATLEVYKKVL